HCSNAQNLPANFNLIPNPSFEYNISGGLDTGFLNNNFCWVTVNGTVSLIVSYHPNHPNSRLIEPHSGNAFATLYDNIVSYYPPTNNFDSLWVVRNYFQTKLLEPLVANQTYYFSCYVGGYRNQPPLTITDYDKVSNVGAYFSSTQLRDYNNPGR